jgi:hypothetical protein
MRQQLRFNIVWLALQENAFPTTDGQPFRNPIREGLPTVRELRSGLQELGMQTDAAFTVSSFIRPNNVRRLLSRA